MNDYSKAISDILKTDFFSSNSSYGGGFIFLIPFALIIGVLQLFINFFRKVVK